MTRRRLVVTLAATVVGVYAYAGTELAQAAEPMPDCTGLTVNQCYLAVQAVAPDASVSVVYENAADLADPVSDPYVAVDQTTGVGMDLTGGSVQIVDVVSYVQHSGTTTNGYSCVADVPPDGYVCFGSYAPGAPLLPFDGGVVFSVSTVTRSLVADLQANLPAVLLIVGALVALCLALRAVHRFHLP